MLTHDGRAACERRLANMTYLEIYSPGFVLGLLDLCEELT